MVTCTISGFYPSTFVYNRFSLKIQLVYCLLSSLSLNLGLKFTGKCITNTFSDCRNLACTSFVWSDSCIKFYWEIRKKADYCSRVKLKKLSFTTQFNIEFLLSFTGCRKVLRKMPEHQGFLEALLFVLVLIFFRVVLTKQRKISEPYFHNEGWVKGIPTSCKAFACFCWLFISCYFSVLLSCFSVGTCSIEVSKCLFWRITLRQIGWREASLLDKLYWFILLACNAKSFPIASVFIFFTFFSLQRF